MATTATAATMAAQRQYLLGTLMLLGVVLLWVSSSFIMNSMFTSMSYNKPWLITYLCTATFSLYLVRPGYQALLSHYSRGRGKQGGDITRSGSGLAGYPVGAYEDENGVVVVRPDFIYRNRSQSLLGRSSHSRSQSRPRPLHEVTQDPPLTLRQTAALALLFCGLWFVANWTVNAALGYTSVSSATILTSMSGFFTLAVGSCVGVDQFTAAKFGSVLLSVIGVVIVSKADHDMPTGSTGSGPKDTPNHQLPSAPLLGDALALGSALAYAFYVILLKVRIRNESRVSMTTFFGFVGLFNIILIWPMGFVLHFSGIERWEWPHGGKLWLSIAINAAITFVSDALYLKAMLMTSPLAVTLGISLTIPLAMIGDIYRGTETGGWKNYLGGAMVLMSFLVNGMMDLRATEEAVEEGLHKGVDADEAEQGLLPDESDRDLAPSEDETAQVEEGRISIERGVTRGNT